MTMSPFLCRILLTRSRTYLLRLKMLPQYGNSLKRNRRQLKNIQVRKTGDISHFNLVLYESYCGAES
jgi:hypothetical protein